MNPSDLYLGSWTLVPELSLYEFGPVPTSGHYTISQTSDRLQIDIEWTTADGQLRRTRFGGHPDGSRQTIETPGVDGFTLTRIDERTLDSEALLGNAVVAYARRVVSNDGDLLVVVQKGTQPDGRNFQNYQVYRRAKEAA